MHTQPPRRVAVVGFCAYEGDRDDPTSTRWLGTIYYDSPTPPVAATLVPVPEAAAEQVLADLRAGRMPQYEVDPDLGVPEPGEEMPYGCTAASCASRVSTRATSSSTSR